jgi:putative membrane protein
MREGETGAIGIVASLARGEEAEEIGFDRRYSLGDHIAFDQFLLAIERNFLLHVTTALNTMVVGLAMFRFFSRNPNDLYAVIGILAFGIAALILAKGVRDNLRMRRILKRIPPEVKD